MTPFRELFKMFTLRSIYNSIWLGAVLLGGHLVLKPLMGDQSWFLHNFIWMIVTLYGGIFFIFQGQQAIIKNKEWIMNLPMQRWKLLCLVYSVGLFNGVVFFVFSSLPIFMFMTTSQGSTDWWKILGAAFMSFRHNPVLVASFFVLAFMLLGIPFLQGFRTQKLIQSSRRNFLGWTVVSIVTGIALAMIYLPAESAPYFFRYLVLMGIGGWGITRLIDFELVLGSRVRLVLGSVVAVLILFSSIVVYRVGTHSILRGTQESARDGYEFLGFLSPLSRTDVVARAVERTTNALSLTKLYRWSRVMGVDRVYESIDFKQALGNKDSVESVASYLSFFPEDFLKTDQLKEVVLKIESMNSDRSCINGGIALSRFRNANEVIPDLLSSSSKTQNCLGLIVAKYFPSEQVIGLIVRNFKKLPDREKVRATATLSILTGNRIALEHLYGLSEGRNPAGIGQLAVVSESQCNGIVSGDLDQVNSSQLVMINRCLRKKLTVMERGELESTDDGLLTAPLSDKMKSLVRKRLGI